MIPSRVSTKTIATMISARRFFPRKFFDQWLCPIIDRVPFVEFLETVRVPEEDETRFEHVEGNRITLFDMLTDDVIIEWRYEEINEAIEDGFLYPRHLHYSAYKYATDVGVLPSRRFYIISFSFLKRTEVHEYNTWVHYDAEKNIIIILDHEEWEGTFISYHVFDGYPPGHLDEVEARKKIADTIVSVGASAPRNSLSPYEEKDDVWQYYPNIFRDLLPGGT